MPVMTLREVLAPLSCFILNTPGPYLIFSYPLVCLLRADSTDTGAALLYQNGPVHISNSFRILNRVVHKVTFWTLWAPKTLNAKN